MNLAGPRSSSRDGHHKWQAFRRRPALGSTRWRLIVFLPLSDFLCLGRCARKSRSAPRSQHKPAHSALVVHPPCGEVIFSSACFVQSLHCASRDNRRHTRSLRVLFVRFKRGVVFPACRFLRIKRRLHLLRSRRCQTGPPNYRERSDRRQWRLPKAGCGFLGAARRSGRRRCGASRPGRCDRHERVRRGAALGSAQ